MLLKCSIMSSKLYHIHHCLLHIQRRFGVKHPGQLHAVSMGYTGVHYRDIVQWLSLFWSGRAILCLKSFLLEKSRPFLYKTPYATSQIQTEQIQRSKRVMGGIRTPTDIGLMLFCLLLMRIVPSIKLLVCFGNNPHSLIGAAKSVVM